MRAMRLRSSITNRPHFETGPRSIAAVRVLRASASRTVATSAASTASEEASAGCPRMILSFEEIRTCPRRGQFTASAIKSTGDRTVSMAC